MRHQNLAFFIPHEGCPHQCSFCNQVAISGRSKRVTADEIRALCETVMKRGNFVGRETEIAYFGGSFTAIDKDYMISLLNVGQEMVERYGLAGIRVSTRPDAISKEILGILANYGVRAVELGCQSMDDAVLDANLRGHTARDVRDASALIRQAGLELGHQMMIPLYQDTEESVLSTARELLSLSPDTLRIYPTTVLAGTRLAELYESGAFVPFSFEQTVKVCAKILRMAHAEHVRVIRLGLHANDGIEGEKVAGIYHPAFGEFCYSRVYYDILTERLAGCSPGNYEVFVNPREISKMIGQKRENLVKLEHLDFSVCVKAADEVQIFDMKLFEIEKI